MDDAWKDGRFTRFECPLCGSGGYVPVRVQKPNGHWYLTAFFQCFGCSVMFRDPVLFTLCYVDTRNDDRTPGGAHSMQAKDERD